jgi:hypothetical protein
MDEPDNIADAFNRLFQLELDWERHRGENEPFLVKPSELEDLEVLSSYLADHLKDIKIQNSIWTLTQNKSTLSVVFIAPVFMDSLEINKEDAEKIYKSISNTYYNDKYILYSYRKKQRDSGIW